MYDKIKLNNVHNVKKKSENGLRHESFVILLSHVIVPINSLTISRWMMQYCIDHKMCTVGGITQLSDHTK